MFKIFNRIFKPLKYIWELILKKVECILNELQGMILLLLGIGVIAFAIVAALWIRLPILPVVISAGGTFIGTFIITCAMRRFSKSFFNSYESDALLKANQEKLDAELELQNAKAENSRLEQDNESKEDEIRSLKHQLSISSNNVGLIYPSSELICGKLPFHINDFYEKPINEELKIYTNIPFIKKYNITKEFYRGVYERSGVLNFAVDLSKINIFETENEIAVYGPFAYKTSIDNGTDHREWKMRGRREREHWEGFRKGDVKLVSVEVTDFNNEKWEKIQEKDIQDRINSWDKIDPNVKFVLDKMVFEDVKIMLKPTGKKIIYCPEFAVGESQEKTIALNDFISDYNKRLENKNY